MVLFVQWKIPQTMSPPPNLENFHFKKGLRLLGDYSILTSHIIYKTQEINSYEMIS